MFLASLIFAAVMLVSNQAQTIIESSAVIATSITALVLALRQSNKKKASPKRATKPARTSTATETRGRAVDAQSIER